MGGDEAMRIGLAKVLTALATLAAGGCSDGASGLAGVALWGAACVLAASLVAHLLFRRRWNRFVRFAREMASGDGAPSLDSRKVPAEFLPLLGTLRRLHAEADRRQAQYEALFRTMPAGYALHEAVLDEAGRMRDYRFLA